MDQKLQPTWLEADGIINTSDDFVLIALNLQPLKFSLSGIFLIIKGGGDDNRYKKFTTGIYCA